MTPERIKELRALSKQGLVAQTDLATAVPELLDTIERLMAATEFVRLHEDIERLRGLLGAVQPSIAHQHFGEGPLHLYRPKRCDPQCDGCRVDKELTKETP